MLVQDALDDVTPVGFILLRFAIGAIVLAAVRARAAAGDGPGVDATGSRDVRRAPRSRSASSAFVGYWFQNAGLERTTTSNSAFITGLFVVFTPLDRDRRDAPRARTATCSLAVVGRDRRPVPAHGRDLSLERRRRAHARVRVHLRHLDLHRRPSLAALRPDRADRRAARGRRVARGPGRRGRRARARSHARSSSPCSSPACCAARSRSACSCGASATSSRAGPR